VWCLVRSKRTGGRGSARAQWVPARGARLEHDHRRDIPGRVDWFMCLPMLAFEGTLGMWLIVKGAAAPASR